jgi:alpha-ketoglutarate-dependent taurine dioxygenase
VSYIEELHYDGITDCSVQASFDSSSGPPNVWCDMRSAYRTLPADLRVVVDGASALHGHVPPPGAPLADFPALDRSRARARPLRIRHPRSGEALLFLPRSPASVVEGLPDDDGREVLAALWHHTATVAERYEALAGHNQLFAWDGLGVTHTNPPIPRAEGRRIWFTVVPAADRAVHPWP